MLTTNVTAPNPSLNLFTASELKQGGISVAIDHANLKNDGWGDDAYDALKAFLKFNKQPFMCEQVRDYAHGEFGLPAAPSNRAWGSVVLSAKKQKLIKRIGTSVVANRKAHCCFATLWEAV